MLKEALPKIVTESVPGPKAQEVLRRRAECMPGAIRSVYPCVIKRGEGAMFEDVDGNIFLDWVGGVGVMNVGYSHLKINAAIKEQVDKYTHTMMNIVTHEGYIQLAEQLNSLIQVRGEQKKTMLVNNGAEAVENAVKIAKSFTRRPHIIVFSSAFHGRTLLAMTMTANKNYAQGMGPFPDGVYRADFPYMYRKPKGYGDAEAIAFYYDKLVQVLSESTTPDYVAAIVLEPMQGEGGFIPAPLEWVKAVRKLCDEKGILLVADEVQTGFARTGRFFASEYWAEVGAAPDIIATAKSIAAGLPLGAVTARAEIIDAVIPGTIGGTFCGNAVACAAALKVLQVIKEEQLAERALEIGNQARARFEQMMRKYASIGDVRGIGSMLGLEFVKDRASKEPDAAIVSNIVQYCAQHGLVVEAAGAWGNVLRFLCPLVVTDAQLMAGLDILEEAVSKLSK